MDVTRAIGMTVSITKTKLTVVGSGVSDEVKLPITVDGGQIEWVSEFPHLGSLMADSGRIDVEVEKRIASASNFFGALRQPDSDTKKAGVQGLCAVSPAVWQ